MILHMSRGSITVAVGNRTITVDGEALVPNANEPVFVVFVKSIRKWDVPWHDEKLTELERGKIIQAIAKDMNSKGLNVDFE